MKPVESPDPKRRVLPGGALAVFLLAGCSSTGPVPGALQPYTDAASFLLPGCSSLLFRTGELDADAARGEGTRACLVARCGSGFEPSKGVGYGPYRGLEVLDFGAGGAPNPAQFEPGEPSTPIAGIPVWSAPYSSRSADTARTFTAVVDDRFVVWSHDRELLAAALARTGDLAALLQPFAAVHLLPDDAESIVCALPRPDTANWGRPTPSEPTVSFFRRGPWRFCVLHERPLPPDGYADPASWCDPRTRTTVRLRPWLLTEAVVVDDSASLRELWTDFLFGLAIFI